MAGLGLVVGLVAALVGGRILQSLLFGVSYTHLPSLLAVTVMLLGVAALACVRPAARALRADPMVALRAD